MAPGLYVGVAGITSREQAEEVLRAIPPGFQRRVALGVLASAKTLAGGPRNPRSPHPDDIARIFPDDPRALNLVHFFTRTTGEGLARELHHANSVGGPYCNGLQLNITWPDVDQLQWFRAGLGWSPRIVLQVGPSALDDVAYNVEKLVERLRSYVDTGAITDVLLDISAGTGRADSPAAGFTFYGAARAIQKAFPALGIGIAGGLGSSRLPGIDLLRFVSIDAESRLRNGEDVLDLYMVTRYLARVGNALQSSGGS